MGAVIRTFGLTKRYGAKLAVNDVNMTVNRGDIYGFIGRNGAGKTTVMKIVLGLTQATAGGIELFGGEDLSSARVKIGSLIESPGLYNDCNAYENMKRFAILTGGADDIEIFRLLDLVGLGNVGNKKVGKFSLGMKQRLGIAVAMLGNPELMVLDEPVNGLDPEGIRDVRDCILKLNAERGVTFLISSHLLDELAKVVTKYGIICDGKMVEEVSAEDIIKRCESGIKVVVDDISRAAELLCSNGFDGKVKTSGEYLLVEESSERCAEINTLLVSNGFKVSSLNAAYGDFEKYFIERIGE